MEPIINPSVADVFASYPDVERQALLQLRQLIYDVAEKLQVGDLTESLKWNQPSYASKTGTPIRIAPFKVGNIALFVHCQTKLIDTFRIMFSNTLTFSGSRAIVLDPEQPLPITDLSFCIESALIYHKNKKRPS